MSLQFLTHLLVASLSPKELLGLLTDEEIEGRADPGTRDGGAVATVEASPWMSVKLDGLPVVAPASNLCCHRSGLGVLQAESSTSRDWVDSGLSPGC